MVIIKVIQDKVNPQSYSSLIDKLDKVGLKYKKHTKPPKELKSSPYHFWVNIKYEEDVNRTHPYSAYVEITCRDEETAIKLSFFI